MFNPRISNSQVSNVSFDGPTVGRVVVAVHVVPWAPVSVDVLFQPHRSVEDGGPSAAGWSGSSVVHMTPGACCSQRNAECTREHEPHLSKSNQEIRQIVQRPINPWWRSANDEMIPWTLPHPEHHPMPERCLPWNRKGDRCAVNLVMGRSLTHCAMIANLARNSQESPQRTVESPNAKMAKLSTQSQRQQ